MDLTVWVDVAIGITAVYLGASLFVTIINESISQVLSRRSKQLIADLKVLLDDPTVVSKLNEHPALAPFFTKGKLGSSYVDTKMLAQQVIGGLRLAAIATPTMQDIVASITAMSDSKLKNQLLTLSQTSSNDVEHFVQSVSGWIDSSLTMMGEQYKRWTQAYSLIIGLIIAIAFNVDTINITYHLYHDKQSREAITILATDLAKNTSKDQFDKCRVLISEEEMKKDPACTGVAGLLTSLRHQDGALGKLPIGWPSENEFDLRAFLERIGKQKLTVYVGWLLTAFATSLGASFWFDLLNRLVNVRYGMRRPEVATPGGK